MLHSRPLVYAFSSTTLFLSGCHITCTEKSKFYFNMPIQTSLWHAKFSDTSPTMHMVVAGLFVSHIKVTVVCFVLPWTQQTNQHGAWRKSTSRNNINVIAAQKKNTFQSAKT
jgi:hypothetical protein